MPDKELLRTLSSFLLHPGGHLEADKTSSAHLSLLSTPECLTCHMFHILSTTFYNHIVSTWIHSSLKEHCGITLYPHGCIHCRKKTAESHCVHIESVQGPNHSSQMAGCRPCQKNFDSQKLPAVLNAIDVKQEDGSLSMWKIPPGVWGAAVSAHHQACQWQPNA